MSIAYFCSQVALALAQWLVGPPYVTGTKVIKKKKIQPTGACERYAHMDVTLVTKLGHTLGATIVFLC